MERFSQRVGIQQVNITTQISSMDTNLRNALWNVFLTCIHRKMNSYDLKTLNEQIWMHCFNKLLDEVPPLSESYPISIATAIKRYYFALKWYEVYDFIDFIANYRFYGDTATNFIKACNAILKRESSAYRFIEKKLVPITSEQEITEIEDAIHTSRQFTPHLNKALELINKRESPDYANVIKESICAVEAMCKLITGDPKETLGKALEELEKTQKIELHENLKKAFKHLYWYTSDSQGIRHGLVGKADLDVEDARFMLIACSAFINYLVVKADKAGIQLQ
jgi:hypothetical protein